MVNMTQEYQPKSYNRNNTPLTLSEKEDKLFHTITRMSHGRLREDIVKSIVNALDMRRSYYVEILRSKKSVKEFLTETVEIRNKETEDEQGNKEINPLTESYESNQLIMGNAEFSRQVREVVCGHGDKVKRETIVETKVTESHSVKQPFVVVKVREVYVLNKDNPNVQETFVGHTVGIYY